MRVRFKNTRTRRLYSYSRLVSSFRYITIYYFLYSYVLVPFYCMITIIIRTVIKYIIHQFIRFLPYSYLCSNFYWFHICFLFCHCVISKLFIIIYLLFKHSFVILFFFTKFRLSHLTSTTEWEFKSINSSSIVYPYLSNLIGKPFCGKYIFVSFPSHLVSSVFDASLMWSCDVI